MEKVISITTDNVVKIMELPEIEYETLYEAVNGLVELVSLNRDIDMWLNEEGKLLGLPINSIATLIWEQVFAKTDIIAGNVIITGGADDEGNTIGLSDESITEVMLLIQNGINSAFNEDME